MKILVNFINFFLKYGMARVDGRALVSLILRLPELRFDSRRAFNVLLRALHENDLAKSFFFPFSLSSSSLHAHTQTHSLSLSFRSSVRSFFFSGRHPHSHTSIVAKI